MISRFLIRVACSAAVFALSATASGAWHHKQEHKVRVRFLAESTFIRGTWGNNEDTYLAELQLRSNGEPILARLIDEYPNQAPPLSHAALTSAMGAALWVQRDSKCDSVYGEMLLRAAPGDLMAILPVKLQYQPVLDRRINPDAILPCYRAVRR